jgi:hypothetical protein
MKLPIIVASSIVLAGCASAIDSATTPDRATTTISSAGTGGDAWTTSVTTRSMTGPASVAVPASPEAVWSALHESYRDLGIPVETIDSQGRRMGNTAFVRRRHLGHDLLSRFFDCGTNAFGASLADTERLQLHVTSRVLADGTDSRMETDVRGSVLSGAASGTAANCRSKGTLEILIETRVRINLIP